MPNNPTYHDLIEQIRELTREVDENKQAISALRTEQLFSEKVLNSLPGIFYLYDEDGNLIRWNKNHETLTGYGPEELPHRSMLEWFSGKDQQRVADTVSELFKVGGRRDVEAELIIKDGTKVPYYFTGVRMTLGIKKYLLGVGIDLSEKKKIEEKMLEEAFT